MADRIRPEPLTERQRQVLDLLARGRTNAQIADVLGISLDGAKWHVSEVIGRLGVSSREEAALVWRIERRPWRRFRGWVAGISLPRVSIAAATGALAVLVIAAASVFVAIAWDDYRPAADNEAEPANTPAPTPVVPEAIANAVGPVAFFLDARPGSDGEADVVAFDLGAKVEISRFDPPGYDAPQLAGNGFVGRSGEAIVLLDFAGDQQRDIYRAPGPSGYAVSLDQRMVAVAGLHYAVIVEIATGEVLAEVHRTDMPSWGIDGSFANPTWVEGTNRLLVTRNRSVTPGDPTSVGYVIFDINAPPAFVPANDYLMPSPNGRLLLERQPHWCDDVGMRVLDSLSGRELLEFPSGDWHRYGAVWTPDSSAILVSEMSAFVADDMGCRLQEGGSYRLSMVDIGSGEIEPMAWEDWFRSYPPTAPDEFVPACSGGGALTVEGLRETWCPEDEQLQWSLHGVLLTGADPYGLLGMFDPESAR